MSRNNKNITIIPPSEPTPRPMLPDLPSHGGMYRFWHSPEDLAQKDADFVRAHAGLLRARADQAEAATELTERRKHLLLKVAELAQLDKLVDHQYRKGAADRAHELTMQAMQHEMEQLTKSLELQRLRRQHDTETSEQKSSPIIDMVNGLTPAEIEELLEVIPEITPDTITTLRRLFEGRLKEKFR